MEPSSSTVVSRLLDDISSKKAIEDIHSAKNEQGESMKAVGAATNNMLLTSILGEISRTNTLLSQLIENLSRSNVTIVEQQRSIVESLGNLSTILAHGTTAYATNASGSVIPGNPKSKDYYYIGTKLKDKNRVYACIIAHILSMVYTRMQARGISYPDSSDCDFAELSNAIQIVISMRCRIQTVAFGDKIVVAEKNKAVIGSIYDHISSSDSTKVVSLPESSLSKIYNSSTKDDIFEQIHKIMDRLTYLHGVLSPKQIEAMQSIGYPLAVFEDGEELRLNVNPDKWRRSKSHPVSNLVRELSVPRKKKYIEMLMEGNIPAAAYRIASEYETPRKK